jgi:hypothetical protein
MNMQRRKELISGALWIVFSPLVLLMGLIAKAPTLTEYYVGVGLCGTWSVCGVVSGFGRIASRRWAIGVQTILCWIAFIAFCLIPAVMLLFIAYKTEIGYFVVITLAMLLALTLIVVGSWRRRQRQIP